MSSDELELYKQLEERVQPRIELFKQKYPEGFHYMPRGTQILSNKRFDEWASYLVKAPPSSPYVPLQPPKSAPPQVAPPSTSKSTPTSQSRQQPATISSVQADQSASSYRPTGNSSVDSYLSFLVTLNDQRTEIEDPGLAQREHEDEGRHSVSNGTTRISENKFSVKQAGKKPSIKKPAVKTTIDANVVKNGNNATGKITSKINSNSVKLVNNGSSSIPVNNDTQKTTTNNASSKVINNDFISVGNKPTVNEAAAKSHTKDSIPVTSNNIIKKPKNLDEINVILQRFYATRREKKQFKMPSEEGVLIKKRNKGKEVATKRPAQKRPIIKSERATKRVRKSKSTDYEATDDPEVDDSESTLPTSEVSTEKLKKQFVVKLKIPPSSEESGRAQESSRQEKFNSSRITDQISPSRDRKDGVVRTIKSDKCNDIKNNSRKEKEGINSTGKSIKGSRKVRVGEDLEENTRDNEAHIARNTKRKIDDDSSDSISKHIPKKSKKKCVSNSTQNADASIKKEEPSTVANADRNSIGKQIQPAVVKTAEVAVQTNSPEAVSIGVQTGSPVSNDSDAEIHHALYSHKMQQATDYKHRSDSEKVPLKQVSDYIEAYLLYADAFYNQYEAHLRGRSYDKLLNPRNFFTAVYGMDVLKNELELVGVLKYIHAVISNILCKSNRDRYLSREREHLDEYIRKAKSGSSDEAQAAFTKYISYLEQMKKLLKQCTENLIEAYRNLDTAKGLLGDNIIIDINDSLKKVKTLAREMVDRWRKEKKLPLMP